MRDLLLELWPHAVGTLSLLLSLLATGHVVLRKRDGRAAIGWVGLIWLVPFLGVVLYGLLGINRIRRRALELRSERWRMEYTVGAYVCTSAEFAATVGLHDARLARLMILGNAVTNACLVSGNRITPLINGEEAYPAMLNAINNAQHSIAFTSYIFDNDPMGRMFVDALSAAVKRGVHVRVLIDAVGARYSFPPIHWALRKKKVPVARFLPTLSPASLFFLNLRSHRKILVVDGKKGFMGGMNIREGHMVSKSGPRRVRDVHFSVTGPVVAELQRTFVEDWAFAAKEVLRGDIWFPPLIPTGSCLARGIGDGPDVAIENVHSLFMGAISSAQTSIKIVTPYFLPDQALLSALSVAARKGISIDIVLPQKSNIALMQWAMQAILWQVLTAGCKIHFSPAPFDHAKIFIVDDIWAMIGSSNWDARSLRLNFEFNLECYDRELAQTLTQLVDQRIQSARSVTLSEMDGRPLFVRLRDGVARLFSPYL
ncbi:MAG: cardiolipin synthase [Myxococcales bacterium]|nr:cardiolipin synthase [Myxococcales bacterium]